MSCVSIHRAYFSSRSQYSTAFLIAFAILFSIGASSERIAAVTSLSSLSTNATFPIVYIASAYVDCGSPLVKDGCATFSFQSTSAIGVPLTETLYAFSTISYLTTETAAAAFAARGRASKSASSSCDLNSPASTTSLCTSTVSSSTSKSTSTDCASTSSALTWHSKSYSTSQTGSTVSSVLVSAFTTLEIATITLSPTGTLSGDFTTLISRSFSRTAEERNYKPSLIPTAGPPLPAGFPGQGFLKRDIRRPQVPAPSYAKLDSRSYDYDSCDNIPPSHDMVTDSLLDVCHFVANAAQYFVSLVLITTAAYLPSWVGYLVQAAQALIESWSLDDVFEVGERQESRWGEYLPFVKTGFGIIGLLRNILAIYTIASTGGSHLDGLPFLSPVLWLDIVLVYDLVSNYTLTRFLSYPVAILGFGMWVVCFWLIIGYCFLGYGTRQYQVLNVPDYCQTLGISWQTDPRRANYVRLQAIIFLSATAGFSVALFSYLKIYLPSREQWDVPTQQEAATRYVPPPPPPEPAPETEIQRIIKRFGDWKKKVLGRLPKYPAGEQRELTLLPSITIPRVGTFRGRTVLVKTPRLKKPELHLSEHLTTIVMIFVLFPFIAGFVMAVILNSHAYLLLGQKGCYGSYVSGRFGYLDLQFVNFRVKLSTWLGLNT